MSKVIIARLVPYTGTDAALTALNPTPMQSEIVIVKPPSGTGYKLKIGDGTTPYASLPFYTAGSGAPQTLQDTLDLGNVASMAGGFHVASMHLDNGVDLLHVWPNNVYIADLASGFTKIGMDDSGALPAFVLKSSSNANLGKLVTTSLSFPQQWILPNNSGTIALLSDITAAGTLQGVLNAGNLASSAAGGQSAIKLDSNGSGNYIVLSPAGTLGLTIQRTNSTGAVLARLIGSGAKGILSLKDNGSAFLGTLEAGPLTAARGYLFPDEGSGAGIDSTLMLHKTKDDVIVGNVASTWNKINATGWYESNKLVSLTELQQIILVNNSILFSWQDTSGTPFTFSNTLEGWAGGVGSAAPTAGAFVTTLPGYTSKLIGKTTDADFPAITSIGNHVVVSETPAVDATYIFTAYVNITAIVTNVLQLQLSFKDTNGVAQTIVVPVVNTAGAIGVNMAATGYYVAVPTQIRAKAANLAALNVTITGAGTNTYDVGGTITRTK